MAPPAARTGEAIPLANALCESCDDSICQSQVVPSSVIRQLNQTNALIRGNFVGSDARADAIQAGFFPPSSTDAVSPIIIGLFGASRSSAR